MVFAAGERAVRPLAAGDLHPFSGRAAGGFPSAEGTDPPPIFFLQKKTGRGRSKRKLFYEQR